MARISISAASVLKAGQSDAVSSRQVAVPELLNPLTGCVATMIGPPGDGERPNCAVAKRKNTPRGHERERAERDLEERTERA